MSRKIKILIAEDTRIARDLLVNSLKNFAEREFGNREYFEIDKAEFYQKAKQKIIESEREKEYYDLIFMDIDFTEDEHGGKRDSGYELIELAFETSPLTKIATYSGQFHAAELWPKYEELKNRGLIVYTFDKSHGTAGDANWMDEGLAQLIKEIEGNKILWKIWDAHNLIAESVKDDDFFNDAQENLLLQNSVLSNLDSALMLLMNIERLENKELIYRMVIYLYHNSLEMICRANKTDEKIIELSNANKTAAEGYINARGKNVTLNFPENVNSQRIFISAIDDERIRFVDTLNYYRNKSIHPEHKFGANLTDVLFSALTFAVSVIDDKTKIDVSELRETAEKETSYSKKKNLLDLLDFIEA